ncbi:MAG: hypothetical protein AAGG44_03755 [Planctomycetota bacterium]
MSADAITNTSSVNQTLPAHVAAAATTVRANKGGAVTTSPGHARSTDSTESPDVLDVHSVDESSAASNNLQGTNRDSAHLRTKSNKGSSAEPSDSQHIDLTG